MRRAGLGRLVLGLDELAGAGIGQDEAPGQAGVEDHDEQDVEIGVVALGAGRLAAHERVRHDPHAHARTRAGAQAAGVAPVVQLEQQAAEEGAQPLALTAVHGCRGVTRRLQDAADLSPWAREESGRRRRRERHPAPGRAVAGGAGCAGLLIPSLPPSSPSPPRPLRPEAASSLALAVCALGKGDSWLGGGEGDKGGGEAWRGAEGRGRGMRKAPGGRGWRGGLLGPSLDPGLRKRIPSKFWPPALQARLWPRDSIWPPKASHAPGFRQLCRTGDSPDGSRASDGACSHRPGPWPISTSLIPSPRPEERACFSEDARDRFGD